MRAILFDLDGTLIDSAYDLAATCNQVAAHNGFAPLALEQLNPLVGRGSRGMMARISGHPEESAVVQKLREQVLELYASSGYPNTSLFEDLRGVMRAINKAPLLRWGIVTSKPRYHSLQILQRDAELKQHSVLVSIDDVQKIKPEPEGLLLALERLQLAPKDAIYVGDNRVDMLAARRAHLACVGVGYGYCSEEDHPANFDPDYFAETPCDLAMLLTSLYEEAIGQQQYG